MDAYRAVVSKRDTRTFLPEPVDDESLRQIVQAGRMAGSSKNMQQCRLVVVREAANKARLAACGQFAAWIPSAPVNVAVVVPNDVRDFDAGRAAQNMMVVAHARGLASCPVTIHDVECGRAALSIPATHRIAIVLAIGRPGPPAQGRLSGARLPLEEYVSWERWRS